ncbi:MAG: hypothetical protein HC906_05170 [Bacteroidales bacterium]|nr:hypothetical protein [Bacteroidales bacterium]
MKDPVDIIKYNEKKADFESDKDYTYKMESKIDAIFMQFEKCVTDKYLKHIEQADKQFKAKQYNEAKTNYEAAHDIFPTETYPKDKIEEINNIIGKQEGIDNLYQKQSSMLMP